MSTIISIGGNTSPQIIEHKCNIFPPRNLRYTPLTGSCWAGKKHFHWLSH